MKRDSVERWPRPKTEWLWLAALLALVSLHFWFPGVETGAAHDTYGATAEGKKALFLLARNWGRENGIDVSRSARPLTRVMAAWKEDIWPGDRMLAILGPARWPNEEEWDALLDWVEVGGNLVVAARLDEPELKIPRIDVEVTEFTGDFDADGGAPVKATLLPDIAKPDLFWETAGELEAPGARGVLPRTLVESDGLLQAIVQPYGAGNVTVIATDAPFSNQALAWSDHDNGVLALRLLTAQVHPTDIVFDESLNDTGTPKVVGVLLQPTLRPITVQALIGLLVFAWIGSRRFGPLLPKSVAPRHNIVDHTDAVGNLTYRTGNGAPALRWYYRQLATELRLKQHKGQENRVLEPLALRMKKDVEWVRKRLRNAAKLARLERLGRREAAEQIRKLATLRAAGTGRR